MSCLRLRHAPLSLLIALIGCGPGPEGKAKVQDDGKEGLERYDSISAAADPAGWTEIQVVESAHPYVDGYENTWSVSAAAGTTEIRVVFERFELEDGYDFLVVANATGATTTRFTGTQTGQETVVSGERVDLRFSADTSITGWGFRARVFQRATCVCPAVFNPVCGADGRTYSNACAAGCGRTSVSYTGECRALTWTQVPQTLESPHPYTNNLSRSWTVSVPGATQIRVHFTRIDTERGYDFVRILDASGRRITEYTGRSNDVTSPAVQGNTLSIQLVSDGSVTGWGFAIDRAEGVGGCGTDAECGADQVCTQVQCIRAPCFNVCNPRPARYRTVTIAELQANPSSFNGTAIEVEAVPALQPSICTRIACATDNPCCNRCSAGFSIGNGITLSRASGDAFGCSGNECNLTSSCTPAFNTSDPGRYVFRGIFQVQSFGGLALSLDNFSASSCAPTGCNSELCGNSSQVSPCVVRPEGQCYRSATCAPQSDGLCGWTQTPALQQCIANARAPQPSVFQAQGLPRAIPDNATAGISASVAVTGAAAGRTVRVSSAITHTYRGDLRVTIVAPGGRSRILHDQTGGSFDDLVLENVDISTLLPTGTAANGTWTLRVADRAAGDVGRLDAFSLTVE